MVYNIIMINFLKNLLNIKDKPKKEFNPDYAIDILTIICAITRVEKGDMGRETFKAVFKL